MKLQVVVALMVLTVPAVAQNRDPVAGAWESVSMTNVKTGEMVRFTPPPLHVIYGDGQYVQFQANGGRPKIQTPRDQMTREELVERSNLQGQYGTYRVAGNKLILHVTSAADPLNEGLEITQDFRVDGDVLIATVTNSRGETYESRFRRLRRTN